jgi:hypothetical protein
VGSGEAGKSLRPDKERCVWSVRTLRTPCPPYPTCPPVELLPVSVLINPLGSVLVLIGILNPLGSALVLILILILNLDPILILYSLNPPGPVLVLSLGDPLEGVPIIHTDYGRHH